MIYTINRYIVDFSDEESASVCTSLGLRTIKYDEWWTYNFLNSLVTDRLWLHKPKLHSPDIISMARTSSSLHAIVFNDPECFHPILLHPDGVKENLHQLMQSVLRCEMSGYFKDLRLHGYRTDTVSVR